MSIGYIIRQAIAVLLIPLCVAAALTFGSMMLGQGHGEEVEMKGVAVSAGLAFIIGAAVYAVIFIFFSKSPLRMILDRGPVQSMWGTITGYRLPNPTGDSAPSATPVDEQGRRVPLWATVAPYLFPIYTMVGVLVVWIVKYVTGMSPSWYAVIQAFVIGFTYSFHIFLVANDIRTKQTGLRTAGYLFTLTLLFIFNIEVLAALAMLVFRNANWVDFNMDLLELTQYEYEWFWDLVTGWMR